MSLRVLLVSSNSSGQGGGEKYLVYLTQGLEALGHEVHILLSTLTYMDGWAEELKEAGGMVHRLHLAGLRQRPLRFLQSWLDKRQKRLIRDFCRQIVPDLILVNQQYDEDGLDYIEGALAANIAPVSGVIHMPMTATKNERPLGRFRGWLLERWYAKHPYPKIFVSKGSRQEFQDYYTVPQASLHIVYLGANLSAMPDTDIPGADRPVHWAVNTPVMGFVGQFVKQKNLDLLMESWQYLRTQGLAIKLLLVGDGPERHQLERQLRALDTATDNGANIDWFITGWQDNALSYLPLMDIYVMTSDFEGFPLALIEAVSCGIPAVVVPFNGASDIAEIAPWVIVTESYAPEAVQQAILQVLDNQTELQNKAAQLQAFVRRYFSVERMAKDTLAVFGAD